MKYRVGSIIQFRTYEDIELIGEVKRIDHTVAGFKIQVFSGAVTRRIDTEQIVKVVKY